MQTDREQADREQTDRDFKNWGHSNPLWIVGGAGQLCILETAGGNHEAIIDDG